jgi:beta-N-acetylhexosaminidase
MSRTTDLARGVIVAGIPGKSVDARLPNFAGYVVFAHNGATLAELRAFTDALRALDDSAPLIAIDQEGGRVMRLQAGVEPMPSMMALGAAADIELAQRAGEQIGFDLRRAGCTLDFAPVLDLAVDPANTVIGTRSFGADPHQAAALGAAVARGLQDAGIVPCYKHFPGHGATAVDSHEALPVIDCDEATLRGRDLLPFAAVAKDAPAMMSAHVVVRAFDSARPATLSPRIATRLLRDDLGFRGAFVSDCLEMNAVALSGSGENAVAALSAGADVLLFSHDLDSAKAAVEAIEAAVDARRIPLERLEEAYARVRRLRLAGSPPLPLHAAPPHPGVGREIARRAVTLLRGTAHADPLSSIVISFGSGEARLEREAPALQHACVSIDPSEEQVKSMLELLERSQRRPIVLMRRAQRYPAQAVAIQSILQRFPDALLISMLEPFDLELFGNARHLVAVYGDDSASIGGLADVIFSGGLAAGRLPIALTS